MGMPRVHSGTIIKVYSAGIAYVRSSEGKQYMFTFDKINVWRGERPKELKQFGPKGIAKGVTVRFTLDSKEKILAVFV